MVRMLCALVGATVATGAVRAEEPLRFRWQPGQALRFEVRQTTAITETLVGKPATRTEVKLALARTWAVTGVDAAGIASLELTITALRQDITRPGPDGKPETLTKDSAVPADAAEMADYLNKPIVKVKVDGRGRLTEPPTGPGADRLAAELPFRVLLPEAAAEVGWERVFPFVVGPPAGTGEKYELKQAFARKGDGVIGLTTEVRNPPTAAADLQPLLPLLWAGEVYVDAAAGAYRGAKLRIEKELLNHAGQGSGFRFESEYAETPAK